MNVLPSKFVTSSTAPVRGGVVVSDPTDRQSSSIPAPEISIVIPLHNEQETLQTLHQCLSETMHLASIDYEIIYVNDGSYDLTSPILTEIAAVDSHVVVAQLSRNFGHQAAITAGLELANGRAIIIMDGDLQDPPAVIIDMIHRWRDGSHVVYAIRTCRKESLIRRIGYWGFYRLHNMISDIAMPTDAGDFCLMDRKVVTAMMQLPECDRFVRGIRAFVGFRQDGIVYERAARYDGDSKYTLRKLTALAVDGMVNFSSLPIRAVLSCGLLLLVVSILLIATLMFTALTGTMESRFWLLLTTAVTIICSVQLISLGVIGEYIRRIFIEVKRRPSYILDTVIRSEATSTSGVGYVRSR